MLAAVLAEVLLEMAVVDKVAAVDRAEVAGPVAAAARVAVAGPVEAAEQFRRIPFLPRVNSKF
jgi:hypothetical protein